MKTATVRRIIRKLAATYNLSQVEIEEIVRLYYSAIRHAMEQGNIYDAEFNEIRVKYLGRFTVPNIKSVKLRMEYLMKSKMKENKKTYDITVQAETQSLVENNEPFYFVYTHKESPELKVGDRIDIVYTKENEPNLKIFKGDPILEIEILDGKHPFYKAAIDMPNHRYMFKRENLTKVRI